MQGRQKVRRAETRSRVGELLRGADCGHRWDNWIGDNDQGVIRLKEPCQRALRVKK
jgi:hypothetical protein